MTVTKQIFSGVAVLAIIGVCAVLITDHMETRANTQHRVESREDEMYSILLRVEANQIILMKRYDAEVNR